MEYIDINVELIREISGKLPFDVYIKRSEGKYTKLFPKGEEMDLGRLDHYKNEKSISNFSVSAVDFHNYLSFVELVADRHFNDKVKSTPQNLTNVLGEMIHLTTQDILSRTEITKQELQTANITVKGAIKLLSQNPASMVKILQMISKHPYSLRHAISSSFFSLLLADKADFKSEKSKLLIGLGSMLHDVGMAMLPFNAEAEVQLNPEQWKLVKEHPQLGKRILDSLPAVPREVSTIVLQHHEQPNGVGYPNSLHNVMIFAPTKVVSIGESFSALISVAQMGRVPGIQEALEIMRSDQGRFDQKYLDFFCKIFQKSK